MLTATPYTATAPDTAQRPASNPVRSSSTRVGTRPATIVVLDDHRENLDLIREVLDGAGYALYTYEDPLQALRGMESHGGDILMTDLNMPGMDGMGVMQVVRRRWSACKVIIFTGYGGVENAVRAIKLGATDFLTKPLNYLAIPDMVKQILALHREPEETAPVSEALPVMNGTHASGNVMAMAAAAAPTNCTVLILGESGVGKEVLADYIHGQSARSAQPFVKVNCTALSESLVESELFGHERGAFTGANNRHVGRFERANGGTLFLDEIGELSPVMQTKLLRVLQTQEIERVGGTGPIKVDFRLVCATHRNLPQLVAEGKFRQDLFYRINTFPIFVPPLRERQDEIPGLAECFLKRMRETLKRGPTTIDESGMRLLRQYAWPGNVRELEHCVERACLLAQTETLRAADFWWLNIQDPMQAAPSPSWPPVPTAHAAPTPASQAPASSVPAISSTGELLSPLQAAERVALKQVLDQHRWNFTHAAMALNISRSTLYLKARKYGLTRADQC